MHLAYPAVLAALLFCVGLYGVLARRNAILVLMSVELMLNAVNLNLVAFDVWLRDTLHSGQALTLFTIAIAAAEIGIGLAIVLAVHRNRGTSDIDRLRDTAETDDAEALPETPGADDTDHRDTATPADGPGGNAGTTEKNAGTTKQHTGRTKKAEATA
ncbi:NADH-quinone oxidoreductase subunit NuoK [Streptomyces californicus]|uniref:NADH-quinone oxidoreductase subunit NuoK n=1 Tax=Streptomyces californicus TaxID=67351 RepID=UPI0037999078